MKKHTKIAAFNKGSTSPFIESVYMSSDDLRDALIVVVASVGSFTKAAVGAVTGAFRFIFEPSNFGYCLQAPANQQTRYIKLFSEHKKPKENLRSPKRPSADYIVGIPPAKLGTNFFHCKWMG